MEAERRVTGLLPPYLTQKDPKVVPSSITLWSSLEQGGENFLAWIQAQALLRWNVGALCRTLERDEWLFVLQPLQKENGITQTGIRPGRNFTLNKTPLPPP